MENFDWHTNFDTANNLMVHDFGSRVKVVTNRMTKKVKIYKDEKIIRILDCDMSCTAYSNFLLSIAKDAKILDEFKEEE